ncbi:MAG TPA: prephenate dehydrogenase/arogenate dehydrogenase family protein [Actinomycetota bacterium]|nr:prephenate dehydrogenase/arogenate dehydrogenase family protein [Actinomycetota bacterium]
MSDSLGRVGIVGAGQVGTMLGLSLRGAAEVLLTDRDDEAARASAEMGAGQVAGIDDVLAADAVVLAMPVDEIIRFVEERGSKLRHGSLVVDTGSVKRPVVEAMRRGVPEGVHAVGGHPMAGTEQPGPAGARPELLRDAAFVLTATRDDAEGMARARALVEAAGARPVEMDAALHDRVVARTSHLPHLAAAALALVASDQPHVRDLAAGGYAGTTRLAASEPEMVAGFLTANAGEVRGALAELRDALDKAEAAVAEGAGSVRQLFASASRARAEALG